MVERMNLKKTPLMIGKVSYVKYPVDEKTISFAKRELCESFLEDIRHVIESRIDEFVIVKEVRDENESYLDEPWAISLGVKIAFPTILR